MGEALVRRLPRRFIDNEEWFIPEEDESHTC